MKKALLTTLLAAALSALGIPMGGAIAHADELKPAPAPIEQTTLDDVNYGINIDSDTPQDRNERAWPGRPGGNGDGSEEWGYKPPPAKDEPRPITIKGLQCAAGLFTGLAGAVVAPPTTFGVLAAGASLGVTVWGCAE